MPSRAAVSTAGHRAAGAGLRSLVRANRSIGATWTGTSSETIVSEPCAVEHLEDLHARLDVDIRAVFAYPSAYVAGVFLREFT